MGIRRASRLGETALAGAIGAVLVGALTAVIPVAGAALHHRDRKVVAVGAENEYADVISQVGGQYVKVTAVMSNPNADPHSFESSPRISEAVSAAQLVVQNGVGYDTFMTKIEAASPRATRKVVDVQQVLGLSDSIPNPHLWYKPTTMPAVAKAIARDLSHLQPSHATYFQQNLLVFDSSLTPYDQELARIKRAFPGATVATTEPVADYMLEAAGIDDLTPAGLQAAVMNGTDPSPQDVSLQDRLLEHRRAKVFVYNQQVTDTVTESFLALARAHGIPVVGVYETMPTPGYHYQTWMLAEADALYRALRDGTSAPEL